MVKLLQIFSNGAVLFRKKTTCCLKPNIPTVLKKDFKNSEIYKKSYGNDKKIKAIVNSSYRKKYL